MLHSSNPPPDGDSELRDFETLLQQLTPIPSQVNGYELFYQAGFAAKSCDLKTSFHIKQKKVGSQSILWSFGGGLASGVAATCLLWVAFGFTRLTRPYLKPDLQDSEMLLSEKAELAPNQNQEAREGEYATELASVGRSLDLDWDENKIRNVIYRGNRRAIWSRQETKNSSLGSSGRDVEPEGSVDQIDNLNWRRSSDDTVLNFVD